MKSLQNKKKVPLCLSEEFTKGAIWAGYWMRSPYFSKYRRGFQGEGTACPSGLLFFLHEPWFFRAEHNAWTLQALNKGYWRKQGIQGMDGQTALSAWSYDQGSQRSDPHCQKVFSQWSGEGDWTGLSRDPSECLVEGCTFLKGRVDQDSQRLS